jgi:hypothetical protein
VFEEAFTPLYCPDNGRPAKPIRLMCGLLILKHLRNLSDESVVEQWSENAYFQYLCGMHEFVPSFPCNSSELVHFRKRIGEKGIELILAIRFIPSMNLMFNASVKVRNTRNTNLATKSPSYALPQVSFLVPVLSEMNTMGTRFRRVWNRCIG